MLGLIVGIAISWYFFNFIENNSYIKNVTIYAIANFALNIIEQAFAGTGFNIITSIIASIIGGLIIVKIMEFAKSKTNSLVMFVVITELCIIAIGFCISFVLYKIF